MASASKADGSIPFPILYTKKQGLRDTWGFLVVAGGAALDKQVDKSWASGRIAVLQSLPGHTGDPGRRASVTSSSCQASY